VLVQAKRNTCAALKLMRKFLKKYGFVPDKLVTDDLRFYWAAVHDLGISIATSAVDGATIEPKTRINRPDDKHAICRASRARVQPKDFSQLTPPHTIFSTSNATSSQHERTESSGPRRCRHGVTSSPQDDVSCGTRRSHTQLSTMRQRLSLGYKAHLLCLPPTSSRRRPTFCLALLPFHRKLPECRRSPCRARTVGQQ
jgi:hypothetical protein